MRIRGVRDLELPGRSRYRTVVGSRAQVLAELAYLEHERDRIEGEVRVWIRNRRQAEARLLFVEQRIALLQGAMETKPSESACQSAGDDQGPQSENQPATSWQEVTLEY